MNLSQESGTAKQLKTSRKLYPGKQTERECLTKREKATTINGTLCLAAKRHGSAESVNLTWTEYQDRREPIACFLAIALSSNTISFNLRGSNYVQGPFFSISVRFPGVVFLAMQLAVVHAEETLKSGSFKG